MNELIALTIVIPLIGIVILGYTLFISLRRKKKKEKRLETKVDSIPRDCRPFIYFGGKKLIGQEGVGIGYQGEVVGGSHSDGKVVLRVHDFNTNTETELGPMIIGTNVIVIEDSNLLFGKVTLRCSIDWDNRICEWDSTMLERIGLQMSLITQQRIEAEVRKKMDQLLEYKETRISQPRTGFGEEFFPPPETRR